MARLPKIVKELSSIEKFEVKDFTILNDARSSIEVIAKDKREYLIFNNIKTATNHAIEVYMKHEDDEEVLEQIELFGWTLKQYATNRVEKEGVQRIISYDLHHKVQLNKAIAYRTI